MKEYLLELLNEEVPARFQEDATRMLKERMETACLSAGITVSFLEAYGTPRRLVLHGELAEEIPARTEERRGPKGEASEAILQSFLASLPAYAQTEKRETPKGSYWFALLSHPARPTQEVLPDLIAQVLTQFPWPKTMRWGSSSFAWVRPLRNILCLFAGVPLNFTFQGLQTTDETVGHRFLAPERFSVSDFSSYKAALSQRFVLLDRAERAEILKKQFQILEQRHNLIIVEDAALFAEVLGLVEWPVALLGKIDPQYQDLPEELIITPMRVHQRYFATRHKDGTLAPFFICVAGTKTADGGKRIVQGNEMVLRARLADARFFFETDKKIPLEQRTQALSQRIFHRRLGTVAERLPRLQAWGCLLQDLFQEEAFFQEVRSQDRERAIALCKADLGTEAVKEFPELQGIMGGYYAALQGESPAVATAIQEHYRPQGIKDAVPETSLGVLLALADKWEMIWSLFQIEERPTGSKDPFALRRAALGIIRILETHHLSLNLTSLFQQHTASEKETVTETCLSFFRERLKGRLKDMGISISVVSSLLEPQELDIWRVIERAPLLQAFLETPEGNDLLQGYRRLTHILQSLPQEEVIPPLSPSLFTAPEQTLYQALGIVQQATSSLGESITDFQKHLTLLATLRSPLDAFFEGVLVACPEATLRRNRQALLEVVRSCYEHLCAFAYLEGS